MRPLARLTQGRKHSLSFGGSGGWTMPPFWASERRESESIEENFAEYVARAYKANGVVFACVLARGMVFSEARFQFQRFSNGRPADLFGSPSLAILERPWPGGTTGELLWRMEQDASLAGNCFLTVVEDRNGRRLRRLRPDCVTIVTGSTSEDPLALDARVVGYVYDPRGARGVLGDHRQASDRTVLLTPDKVAHYSPIPDPDAQWRGMSWLQPVVSEVLADQSATRHKLKYFENGTVGSVAITYDSSVSQEAVTRFAEMWRQAHAGTDNAYKTFHLGGGADAKTLGADLKQLDFKVTQGAGEPLALDTPVPTPQGWTTMGDVAVGDEVIGRSGKPVKVLAVGPVHHDRRCYRVTFNDRTSVVTDASHLWTVMDRNTKRRAEVSLTTEQVRDLIVEWAERGNGGNRIGVPAMQPVEFPPADLLVDPYVLGAWLGDGQTSGAAICGAPDDLAFIASEIERRGYVTSRWSTAEDKGDVVGIPGGLLTALRALGVLGDKHIPREYLRASVEQRLDLLRGLMDTDGSVGHVGSESCEFSSKWEHLARQVAELVRSLGIRATLSEKKDARSRTGAQWRLTFRADPDMVPFLLPRKAARCATPVHVRNRAIVSIEPVESVPVRCIAVDSPDHLFAVGEGWVLTHNTRIAAAAGVGAVIAQLSEGLQGSALNSGNYNAAKRRFADGTIRPLWRSAAASLEALCPPPDATSRLWYDARDVPFLQEDQKDEAAIQAQQASTINSLITAGFNPDDVIAAVVGGDLRRLAGTHSGMYSVQLQPAGVAPPKARSLDLVRDEHGVLSGLRESDAG